MPRRAEKDEQPDELQGHLVEEFKSELAACYTLGLLFLEMLDDVEKQRGNYHTVGANRLHTKFLVTSNCNSEKFYAGGARLKDLAQELAEEYSWSDESILDALQEAVKVFDARKGSKTTK
jgi:hypothetical protein